MLPARNEAGAISGTIAALVALEYADAAGAPCHELLVVDDGSDDGTGAVAAEARSGASARHESFGASRAAGLARRAR